MKDITEFKDIPHFTNYQATEDGKIYCKNGFYPSVSTFPTTKGHYLTCSVVNDDDRIRRDIVIHRLVALAYHYPGEHWRELDVNHIDGDKTNNHKSNLEWCTKGENLKHAYEAGLRVDYRQYKLIDLSGEVTICKSIADISKIVEYNIDTVENFIAISKVIDNRLDGRWRIEYDNSHEPIINRSTQAQPIVCLCCETFQAEIVDTTFEAAMVMGVPRGTIQFNLTKSVRVNMLNGYHYWYENDEDWIRRVPKFTIDDVFKSRERAKKLALRTFQNFRKMTA